MSFSVTEKCGLRTLERRFFFIPRPHGTKRMGTNQNRRLGIGLSNSADFFSRHFLFFTASFG